MNRFATLACLLATGVLLWMGSAPATLAQSTRTLTIDDGTVHIDGQLVPKGQWPPSLDLSGVQAQYQFVGIQRPVVEIDGRLFAVTDRLEPVSEREIQSANASVILRDLNRRSSPAPAGSTNLRPTDDLQAAHREYLSEVQRQSHQLYERLLRERRMEQQTYELAKLVRQLPEGPERQAKVDTLRATLNRIFDLKQENRRREIEQLQRQILELQKSIRKREDMREQMVEHRLQQLIDASTPQP